MFVLLIILIPLAILALIWLGLSIYGRILEKRLDERWKKMSYDERRKEQDELFRGRFD